MSRPPYAPEPSDDHATLIDELGGPKAVSDLINRRKGANLTGQAVSNWKRRGIPYAYRAVMAIEAREREVSVPVGFLGEGSVDAA